MNRVALTSLLAAALGVGWLLGAVLAGSRDGRDEEIVRLRGEAERMRRALGARGPILDAEVGLGPGRGKPVEDPPEGPESFDVTRHDRAGPAFRALLAHARHMLARGPEGHLALVDTLDRTFEQPEGKAAVQGLLGDEIRAARFRYPALVFALNHDAEVADLTETVLRTMAEDPRRLARLSTATLALFTDDLAPMLPGMVPPKRLDRIRGHLEKILTTPAAQQARPVQLRRQAVQRALLSWRAPMTPEEAAMRLRAGVSGDEEALALLRRLRPQDIEGLDLDRLVGPLLEREGWKAVGAITRLAPAADQLARLDERVIRGVDAGDTPQSFVSFWLRNTKRGSWQDARPFIESGMQQSGVAGRSAFLMVALAFDPPPDDDWVDWAERTYRFTDRVRLFLKTRREGR